MGLFGDIKTDITDKLKTAWETIKSAFESIAGVFIAIWDKIKWVFDTIRGFLGLDDNDEPRQKSESAEAKQARYHNRSARRMAQGGLITEPIYGMGLNSGRNYLMGESGPEMVTPVTQTKKEAPARNFIFNIEVKNNMDQDALIQRIKQEIALDDKRLGQI